MSMGTRLVVAPLGSTPALRASPNSGPAPGLRLGILANEEDLDDNGARRLFRSFTAGVSVITAQSDDGPVGMTASTLTSVSLDPPLVLTCISIGSRTLSSIVERASFAVHVLGPKHVQLATVLAQPGHAPRTDIGYRDVLGVPVIPAALAWAVCDLEDARPYGDHVVVVGRVIAAEVVSGDPLVWHDGSFAALASQASATY